MNVSLQKSKKITNNKLIIKQLLSIKPINNPFDIYYKVS